jgi:hypothetical protein
MRSEMKAILMIALLATIFLPLVGCVQQPDQPSDNSFDISDTVLNGKYMGKNYVNDSIVKITYVKNSPKAEEIYALIEDPNGTLIFWHAFGENPDNRHPISAISHIDISRVADNEDISWNDIYEDHKLLPDEKFFISKDIIGPMDSGYKFILEYKDGERLLEVEIESIEVKNGNKQPTPLKCEPEVKVTGFNYTSDPTSVPYQNVHRNFSGNYTGSNLSQKLRNLTINSMLKQAGNLGENTTILYESIKVNYYNWDARPYMIPCYAEKAMYKNEWIWALAFNRANGFEDGLGHIDIFFVSISTIQTQLSIGCNSTAIIYQFGCD